MSFLNPLFLFATGAALLPVLYHLVRRTRVETVPFPSLMLLKGKQEEIVRRRRWQDLLLMVIRALLFGLLALAFARPFLPPAQQQQMPLGGGAQSQSTVLLVDRSFSMRQEGAFEAARAAALRQIEAAGSGGGEVSVVAFDEEAHPLTPLGRDPALHRSAVRDELEAGYRSTRLRPALQRAADILQRAEGTERRIVLISDFQRNAWPPGPDSLTLAAGLNLETVRVGAEAPGNAYVRGVRLVRERAGEAPHPARYEARVAAQGASAEGEKTVRLTIGGELAGRATVPAGTLGTATLRHVPGESGPQQGALEVRAEGDALPADDRYYTTYVAGERPRLLLVSGDRSSGSSGGGSNGGGSNDSSEAQGSAFFLQKAFALGRRYRLAAAGPERLAEGGLEEQDVIVLSNVAALTGEQRRRLERYVEGGGGLVIAFGDRLDASAFSEDLQALGVGAIGEVAQQETSVAEVEPRHPVFDAFSGASESALWRPVFRRYAQVDPAPGARVIGTYSTGDPFVIEQTLGQGRVLAMTSAFDTGWTTLPVTEAFVPLVYQLASRAARGAGRGRRVFTVGDAVPLGGQPGDTWDVRTPEGETHKVTVGEDAAGRFRQTEVPGSYQAARGDERFLFSVNVAPEESNLAPGDPEKLRAALKRAPQAGSVEASAAPAGPTPEDAEREQQFWKYLLLAVIALFALETFLANRRLTWA